MIFFFQVKGPQQTSGHQSVTETIKKQTPYAPNSKTAKELNEALAYHLAKDMLPFQHDKKPGFLKFAKKAIAQYKVPT